MDPLNRFVALYGALNASRGFFEDSSALKFASLAALACPGSPEEVAGALRRTAEDLKKGSGWFGQLRSSVRFIVSALLVQAGDDPARYLEEVERVREAFRSIGLRRSGSYEPICILILRRVAGLKPIAREAIERLQSLYEELKRHHWWLTGPEDLPVCALLAGGRGTAAEIADGVERVYQSLQGVGFSSGDPLQTTAGLLFLSSIDPGRAASTFGDLARGFRERGVSIWKSDYDELAILASLSQASERTIGRVLEVRKGMEALRPRPNRSLSFSLAASIAFLEAAGFDEARGALAGAKAMLDMQHILNARAAAAAGAAGGAAS